MKRARRLVPLLALGLLGAKLPDGACILPASEPIRLCSRAQPSGLTGRRAPSEAEVLEAERALPGYMARVGGEIGEGASRYHRQYLGIWQGTRPALYLNAFIPIEVPADAPLELRKTLERERDAWKTHFAVICDGGARAWGVVYHPDTKQFDELQVNGLA